jgi:nitronate monooxygenase
MTFETIVSRLKLPVVGAPMFLVSGPDLVIAQCRAGIIGAFPALNARSPAEFGRWLSRIAAALPIGTPFAVNLIAHRSNARLETDLALCVRHRVPIVITSLGAREDINAAIHGYGGIVLHDVIDDGFARKAVAKGADGLILVAAGAGGHAGTTSPFALVREVRRWFDGPIALSGAIAGGEAILATRALGADLAYVGSAFIATEEAEASSEYKRMVVASAASDIVYTDRFSGVHGNYLRPSIVAAGLDPDAAAAAAMDFSQTPVGAKAWRDIWGAGQGIGAVDAIVPAGQLVERFAREYAAAAGRFFIAA